MLEYKVLLCSLSFVYCWLYSNNTIKTDMSRVTILFPSGIYVINEITNWFHVLIFNFSMRENKVYYSHTGLPTYMLNKHFKYFVKFRLLFKLDDVIAYR